MNSTSIVLGEISHTGPLSAGNLYTGHLDAVLPFVASGPRFFVLVTDAANQVNELPADRANNGVAAQKALDDSGFYVIAHVLNGAAMAVLILLLVGLSFGARYPWRTTGLTALLFLLLALQSLLAHTGIAAVSALHVINGLVILGLVGYLTRTSVAFRDRPAVVEPQRAIPIES